MDSKLLSTLFLLLPALTSSLHHPDTGQVPFDASLDAIPSMPLLGFGTWNLDRSNVTAAVSTAIEVGYRHIDCAVIYGNQKDVGKGIAEGLAKAGIGRKDIWVTSKLWNDKHAPGKVEEGIDEALAQLGLDYLDLYLIHWPVASRPGGKNEIDFVDTFDALRNLPTTGKTRYIGISNFDITQLRVLPSSYGDLPIFHQMELHPYLQQQSYVTQHFMFGLNVTAYSPFGNTNPTYAADEEEPPLLLQNEVMVMIAEERGCTPAQVALAWGMSRGIAVIPKSSHESYIRENYGSLECQLTELDMEEIEGIEKVWVKRFNNPSEGWGVPLFKGLEDGS